MAEQVTFIVLLLAAAFVFALALQMRWLAAMALRKALSDKFGGQPNDPVYRRAVVEAVEGEPQSEAARHLVETYPRPLSHIRLARRFSILAPVALTVILLAGRFVFGVI